MWKERCVGYDTAYTENVLIAVMLCRIRHGQKSKTANISGKYEHKDKGITALDRGSLGCFRHRFPPTYYSFIRVKSPGN